MGLLTSTRDELSPFQRDANPSVWISFNPASIMVSFVFDKAVMVCNTQKGLTRIEHSKPDMADTFIVLMMVPPVNLFLSFS